MGNYDDAPATPDADDPAIWVNPDNQRRSLVIGTAKDAGLLVYDMSGQLVQALLPPNAPHVSPLGDINGFAFNGSTQFLFVNFADTLAAFWN